MSIFVFAEDVFDFFFPFDGLHELVEELLFPFFGAFVEDAGEGLD